MTSKNPSPTISFDVSTAKIAAYNECCGPAGEITPDALHVAAKLECTSDPRRLASTDFFIIAEATKVIENTQRDLNIALMNKLAILFDKLGIATSGVLTTAGSKWRFLKFSLGLVGRHCPGVDPYTSRAY